MKRGWWAGVSRVEVRGGVYVFTFWCVRDPKLMYYFHKKLEAFTSPSIESKTRLVFDFDENQVGWA